jgi:hypothetical protein
MREVEIGEEFDGEWLLRYVHGYTSTVSQSSILPCHSVPASARDACGCLGDTRGGSAGFGFLGGGGRGFDG